MKTWLLYTSTLLWYICNFGPVISDNSSTSTCGYQACNPIRPGFLNVHIVSHTHDDVGWLKTVDQYYYGARNGIARAGVQYILDNVIDELLKNVERKFTYVEVAFFYRWWQEQTSQRKRQVQQLVNKGQLQFTLGGWSMNDEAATHYNAIIDQHTTGHRFLKENFGECGRPLAAWQIDPFGHSREQASLFAQMGFDSLYFARLDYQDKATRLRNKTLEMVWRGSDDLGTSSDLFTGAFYQSNYCPPPGLCFDDLCADQPVMDDKTLRDYNVDTVVDYFIALVQSQASGFTTNNLMLTMGCDFMYQNAGMWFKNLDKLITYVNARQSKGSRVNVMYSTPACYSKAVNGAQKVYQTKTDDFFPYAHEEHGFWTGYYTSRAALKYYTRRSNNILQICKQANAFASTQTNETVEVMKRVMGVLQHHDAVSGTSKQQVAYDYAWRLSNASAGCYNLISDVLAHKMLDKGQSFTAFDACPLTNISFCGITENNTKFTVVIYNPLSQSIQRHYVRLPVISGAYQVMDSKGNIITNQLLRVSNSTRNIPERHASHATHELVFAASLPPLGANSYVVTNVAPLRRRMNSTPPCGGSKDNAETVTVGNEYFQLDFNCSNGQLYALTNRQWPRRLHLTHRFKYYYGYRGNNSKPQFAASGAYIFRPSTDEPPVVFDNATLEIHRGPILTELRQTFSTWLTAVYRVYKGQEDVEFEWTVGSIPSDDKKGREVVSEYITDLKSSKTFYTDANGRQVLKRVRDYRHSWNFTQTEPVAGNYYPVNSKIYIEDGTSSASSQFAVLTDRSQGGTSLRSGQLEVMLHRWTVCDDALGVGEPLQERGADGHGLVVRGRHRLWFGARALAARHTRRAALREYARPLAMFAAGHPTVRPFAWSELLKPLPPNVHMLTLESMDVNHKLIRLEHIYQKNEDKDFSKPVTVDLNHMFCSFSVQSITELTLSANQKKSVATRLKWRYDGAYNYAPLKSPMSATPGVVRLEPMQIRTFDIAVRHINACDY